MILGNPTGKRARRVKPHPDRDPVNHAKCDCDGPVVAVGCPRHDPVNYIRWAGHRA